MNPGTFPPTVFVVDDDAAVRGSLKLLLRSLGMEVETFSSGPEFLDAYCEDRPGCLLLDRRMPLMSGLEVQIRLNERHSILPIIFMAACSEKPVVLTAIRAGAIDFLEKPFSDQRLIDSIRVALEKDCANRRAMSDPRDIITRLGTLTQREREVLELIVHGHTDEAVVCEPGVEQRKVEGHRAQLMKKMCASSNAHLMQMVRRAKGSINT